MSAAVKYVRFLEALYFMIRLQVGLWQNIGLAIQMIFSQSTGSGKYLEKDKYKWAQVGGDWPSGKRQSLVTALGKDSAFLWKVNTSISTEDYFLQRFTLSVAIWIKDSW